MLAKGYFCSPLPNFEIITPGFDSNLSHLYDLTVSVSDNEIAYTLYNRKESEFLMLKSQSIFTHEDFKQLVNYDLNGTYNDVRILVVNPNTTFFPSVLFDKSLIRESFGFNHPYNNVEEQLHFDSLKKHGAENIFKISNLLRELMGSYFPKYRLMHYSSPLIEGFAQANEENEKFGVFVHEGFMHIIYIHGHRLQFVNSFEFETHEDLLYYVLACCDQLDLNPKAQPILLFGDCARFGELLELLRKYFMHADLGHRPDSFNLAPVFDELPPHLYFHLFSAPLCE